MDELVGNMALLSRGNDLPRWDSLWHIVRLQACWFPLASSPACPDNVFMIPSDIDSLAIIKSQTSPDRRPFSRFQKLAEKFHCSTTRSSTPRSPCHPDLNQPSYLVNSNLPPPGQAHYAARRTLWLTPTKVPEHSPSSSSRLRLEQLLSQPGAVHNDEAWKDGVEKVWKGLVGGGRLRRRLPMNLVVCITHRNHITLLTGLQIKVIHAGWLRDPETWPTGAVVPESDDELSRITSSPCPLPRITSKQESCMPPAKPEDKQCAKHFQDI